MKLYATTTSERASKGQGGNEWLTIDLTVKNDKTSNYDSIGSLKLYYDNNALDYQITFTDGHELVNLLKSKGKKQ